MKRDTIPDRVQLRPLVLAALYNHDNVCTKDEIADEITEAFNLSEKALAQMVRGRSKLLNQIDWVTGTDLGSLGLVIDHGDYVELTPDGVNLIETHHDDDESWEIKTIRRWLLNFTH